MKIKSDCFIDHRLWDLLSEIERRFYIKSVEPKRPGKLPVFDLFVRLGCAHEITDRNDDFGWVIAEPGLQLLRVLRAAYVDELEDEDDGDDGMNKSRTS